MKTRHELMMQLVAVLYRDLLSSLFWIVRVVENRNKLDAAMPKLREAERAAVPRIERRGSVIRRKEDERVEQLEHTLLLLGRKCCKGIACRLGFTTVAQDHFHQVDAAAIVAVWRGGADAPERGGEKLRAGRTVEVPFVKGWPNIVAFKIGKDISDEEWLQPGLL